MPATILAVQPQKLLVHRRQETGTVYVAQEQLQPDTLPDTTMTEDRTWDILHRGLMPQTSQPQSLHTEAIRLIHSNIVFPQN